MMGDGVAGGQGSLKGDRMSVIGSYGYATRQVAWGRHAARGGRPGRGGGGKRSWMGTSRAAASS